MIILFSTKIAQTLLSLKTKSFIEMWEYFTISSLIFLTWYDNLWLKKFLKKSKKYILDVVYKLVWELMKLQTRLKNNMNPTEMIQKGYHVDAVYLYVYENEFIKQYDMLRVFREKLVEPSEKYSDIPTIHRNSNVDFFDFVKMCYDPNSNFNQINENLYYLLEVNYTYDMKKYTIYYDSVNNKNIRFPIYSEDEIKERDVFEGGINSALVTENENEEENGKDVTKELKKLAGPMQNFYDGTEYVVLKEWFMNDKFPKNSFIQIVDFIGDLNIIKPNDKFLSFLRNK